MSAPLARRRALVALVVAALAAFGLASTAPAQAAPVPAAKPAASPPALVFGSPVPSVISVAGGTVSYAFSGTKGQRLALKVTGIDFPVDFFVTRPDGSTAPGLTCNPGCGETPISLPTVLTANLDATGTWTLTVDPLGDSTGTVTFTAGRPVDTTIAVTSGTTLNLTYKGDGSDVRLTFPAAVGQRVTLGVTASDLNALDGANTDVTATLLRPDGTVGGSLQDLFAPRFAEQQPTTSQGLIDTAGTWTLLLHPVQSTSGTQTAKFGLVRDPALTVKVGAATTLRDGTPGQNLVVNATGATAGRTLDVTLDSASWTSGSEGGDPEGGTGADLSWVDSDGGQHDVIAAGQSFGAFTVPATGAVTLVLDPVADTVGTAVLTIRPPAATTTRLTLGTPTTTKIGRGNSADFTFAGTAGRRLGVQLTATNWVGGSGRLGLSVLRPDGSVFYDTGTSTTGPEYLEAPALDTSGTWTMVITPSAGSSGTFTFTARQPVDLTGTLTAGQAVTTKIGTPGQQARYSFHGLKGRRVTLDTSASVWNSITDPDTDGTANSQVSLYRPDGSLFGVFNYLYQDPDQGQNASFGELSAGSPPGLLDVSGTWTLVVAPNGDATGSQTFTLGEVQDVTGSLSLGAAKAMHVTTPGQQGHYTFTWDGQRPLSLSYTGSTITDGEFTLVDPDGTPYAGSPIAKGSAGPIPFPASGRAGTWTLTVDPSSSYLTGSLTATLTEAPAQQTAPKPSTSSKS